IENDNSSLSLKKPPRSVGLIGLISIGYLLTSSGPYGIELVSSCGSYVYVLLTFLLLPIVWSIPTSLITAELSLMVNDVGGCSLWAEKAFGEDFSFFVGILSWFSATVDLSLYAPIFVHYLSNIFIDTKYENYTWCGKLSECYWCTFLISIVLIIIVVAINIWGTEKVGYFGAIFSIVLLIPFVIFVCIGIGKVQLGEILSINGGIKNIGGVKWNILIITVLWSISGYDQLGQLAGEIKSAKRNYPIGVFAIIIISTIFYILPLIVGMQFERDPDKWYTGEFSNLAVLVGGKWLEILMSIGGMASAIGGFLCSLKATSNNFYSISERGLIPKFFSKLLPKRRTPYIAILFNAAIVSLFISLPFESILNLDMAIYSIVIAIECVVYIKLYLYNPNYHRPYKAIPNKWFLPYLASPIILTITIFIFLPLTIQWNTIVFITIIILLVFFRY
ncbi:hypothetical protein DICPUDRAFT_6826, partial [Dictyostelium purpureum]